MSAPATGAAGMIAAGGGAAATPSRRPLGVRLRIAVWLHRLRRGLGIRRGVRVGDVYYKELTPESLARALSKRGRGYKDYRVTFADRSKMVIRCEAQQVYGDLMGMPGLERLEPLLSIVRPGGRVLEFDAGTGYRAFWLSFVVGPSGGVVAVSLRREHTRFAQKRYPHRNVSFEVGEGFALSGETDGSFDGVVALHVAAPQAQRRLLVRELARLVAPGGALLVGLDDEGEVQAELEQIAEHSGAELRRYDGDKFRDAMLLRPVEPESNRRRRK